MIKWLVTSVVAFSLVLTIAFVQNAKLDMTKSLLDEQDANLNRRINDKVDEVWADICPADYYDLQEISVKIIVPGGSGSGVLYTKKVGDIYRTYVWTAGHVAVQLKTADGWLEADIYQEYRYRGLRQSVHTSKARVIAYSSAEEEDLALLEVVEEDWSTRSARFDASIQYVGTEVVHVGSTVGIYNSVSLGIISQTDRDLGDGRTFDQTSCMGYPGSSGGGVFLKDGTCIGLLTRGVGPGLNFIVPVRRMKAWAKSQGIEWALDDSIQVPLTRTATSLEKHSG